MPEGDSVPGAGASETRAEAFETVAEEAPQPIQKTPEQEIDDLFSTEGITTPDKNN